MSPELRQESDKLGRERAGKVKEAMEHAWRGYKQYAWGFDELAPRGKKGKQAWGGMGVTLVDSLGACDRCLLAVLAIDLAARVVFLAVKRPAGPFFTHGRRRVDPPPCLVFDPPPRSTRQTRCFGRVLAVLLVPLLVLWRRTVWSRGGGFNERPRLG